MYCLVFIGHVADHSNGFIWYVDERGGQSEASRAGRENEALALPGPLILTLILGTFDPLVPPNSFPILTHNL